MKTKGKAKRKTAVPVRVPAAGRGDHEVVCFGGRMIPILGTVGGSKEEGQQTARNIEAFLATRKQQTKQTNGANQ